MIMGKLSPKFNIEDRCCGEWFTITLYIDHSRELYQQDHRKSYGFPYHNVGKQSRKQWTEIHIEAWKFAIFQEANLQMSLKSFTFYSDCIQEQAIHKRRSKFEVPSIQWITLNRLHVNRSSHEFILHRANSLTPILFLITDSQSKTGLRAHLAAEKACFMSFSRVVSAAADMISTLHHLSISKENQKNIIPCSLEGPDHNIK